MASHALVAGGTRGIGRAVVKELADAGLVVSVIARRPPDAGREVAGVHYWQADLLEVDRLPQVLAEVADGVGPLGAVVCTQRYRVGRRRLGRRDGHDPRRHETAVRSA